MQTITLEPPQSLTLSTHGEAMTMFDTATSRTHAWAFRCFDGNFAPHWMCQETLHDAQGRAWHTTYFSVPDDFGDLVEVPR